MFQSGRSRRRLRSGLIGMLSLVAATYGMTAIGGNAQAQPHSGVPESANPVIAWSLVSDQVMTVACLAPGNDPILQAKLETMTQIAVHDAANTVRPTFAGYAHFGRWSGASLPAAVASAARHVLVPALISLRRALPAGCADNGINAVLQKYADTMAQLPAGQARNDGVSIGQEAAHAILDQRWPDGTGDTYPRADNWRQEPTFVVHDLDEWTNTPGPSIESTAYAVALEESRRLGGDGFVTPSIRTRGQTEVALFWRQSPTSTWEAVARDAAVKRRLDPWHTARLLGVLDITIFDAYMAAATTAERPTVVSQQRAAFWDVNPWTNGDPRWTPLTGVNPNMAAEAAAAMVNAAAAHALATELRSDRLWFSLCSSTVPGRGCATANPMIRRFASLSQAAAEAGRAQVLLGRQLSYEVSTDMRRGVEVTKITTSPANPLTVKSRSQDCYPGVLPQSAC